METIACDLCGADQPRPFATDNGYQLVRCGCCGLIYVNPRPTRDEITGLYRHWQIGDQKITIGRSQRKDAAAHKWRARQRLARVLEYASPPGRLLEIGCGGGWFLQAAARAGFEVEGLELSPDLATLARERAGARIIRARAEEANLGGETYDVVCHFYVLSHLLSPTRAFETTHRALKPGGWLFFLTGNRAELQSIDDGRFPGSDWGTPQHLFHFSEPTIRQLLDKTGFELVAIRRTPVLLDRLTAGYLRTSSRRWAGMLLKAALWYAPPLRWTLRALIPLLFPSRLRIQNLDVVARKPATRR